MVLSRLTYFTSAMSSKFIYIVANVRIFHGWVILLCVHIHSSVHEHLGCFHIFAIVNKAVMIMRVKISLWDSGFNFLMTYPGVTLLDHVIVLFLNFEGSSIPFSIAAAPFHIPTNRLLGFQFLQILSNAFYFFDE